MTEGVEIYTPLDDESATHERTEDDLTKALLLDTLNLNDDAVLNDHADFTETDALNGRPNMIQIQVAGGR